MNRVRCAETVTVALILFAHCIMLVISAWIHSPVVDEVGHLPAGLFHWKFGRYDLYSVNPPLVRMVAAAPLHFFTLHESWGLLNQMAGSRSEWPIGIAFCALNGEKVFSLFSWARCCCIPFSLIGGYFCFRWSRELHGRAAGIVAILLWCVSPMTLGFGALCVPDVGASAMGITFFWFFRQWLGRGGWSLAFQAGCLLGLTLLTKLTWVLLGGLLPALWLMHYWLVGARSSLKQLIFVFAVGWVVLNLGYEFEGTFTPLGQYEFVSNTLAGGRGDVNRFRNSILAPFPVPLPSAYVTGIDVQKVDFELGYRSYLRGHWKHGGWWYYYLYACLVKVPLGAMIIALLALWIAIRDANRSCTLPDDILLLAPAAVIFIAVSSQTGFNHHLRYVFPAAPFLIVWISRAGRWLDGIRPSLSSWSLTSRGGPGRIIVMRAMVVGACMAWYVESSLLQYPHSLSYFNELAGGPIRGHEHLVDSNIDWGQDLLFLKRWLDKHPEVSPLGLAYFGFVDPRSAGITYTLPPSGFPPVPASAGDLPKSVAGGPRSGYFAVSINYLHGMRFSMANGEGGIWSSNDDHFTYFRQLTPIGRAGYSIYIYYVSEEDAQRLRHQLGWRPNAEPEAAAVGNRRVFPATTLIQPQHAAHVEWRFHSASWRSQYASI